MVRSGFRDRYFTLGLSAAIVSVLVILAVLQYRWSNQVSAANETQIGANLRSLMMDWHFDLFRDFSAIAVALQVGPDSGARDDWHDYLARYRDWQDFADDPEIVKSVFVWETSAAPNSRLFWLDTERLQIVPSDTPPEMQSLLNRLQRNSSSLQAGLNAWNPDAIGGADEAIAPEDPRRTDPMTGWQFDPNIPALVHPIVHHPIHGTGTPSSRIDWIVIRFNLDLIRSELLPKLARRFFGGEQGLDYRLEIVSKSASGVKTIYSSDGLGLDQMLSHVDAEMNIFGPPPESTEALLVHGPRTSSMIRSPDWHNFSAPSWFPIIQDRRDSQNWTLRVQHRSGSLAGIVAGVRRRNLAISFGVLVLLAVSMSLVVVASYRAQRFARLQMNFVAVVSHELRTPLAVISSAAENIADGVVTGKQLSRYSLAIRNQTRRLTELVDDILSFAVSQDGSTRYRFRVLDVADIVTTAIENTRELLDRDGFTLEQAIEPKLPKVRGDLSALNQCLQNLIVNAVKYSGESRWIGVYARTGRDHAGFLEVQITVEDHGPGIPASEVEQIFTPFYRTHAAREAQIRGTGLGLTLARTIAEEMGGSLTVVTKEEHGSAFTLHLPPMLHDNRVEPSLSSIPEPTQKA